MRKSKAQLEVQASIATMAEALPAAATAVVPAYDNTALAKHEAYWQESMAELAKLPCESPEQEAWWAARLNEAQQLFNKLDAERTALVAPLNAEVKDINGAHKPVLSALEEAKALISGKLSEAATARGRLATGHRADAQALALAGDSEGCQAALARIGDDVKVEGVATVWSWKVKSTNVAVMHHAFLLPDEKTLAAVCKSFKDREDAPVVVGVEFERVAKVQPRGGAK